ncbi:unnamed protein product [Prorocentrum cordatum]|uniref:SIR2-like domain-containing protein n=1 Tax=Prorocentrum cordatum TaxID=2364126 RepID=A0ABN9UCS7_9DINO|nr:unnamed protein product [Polarella glacialis]
MANHLDQGTPATGWVEGQDRRLLIDDVLHLWPGLAAAAASDAEASSGAEGLPVSPEDCRGALAPDSPYMAFLSDLLRSKTVLLVGWTRLPPEGHFGEALRQAWRKVKVRDPSRQDPLAYALAPAGAAEAGCWEECGLEVLVCDAAGDALRGLAAAAASPPLAA